MVSYKDPQDRGDTGSVNILGNGVVPIQAAAAFLMLAARMRQNTRKWDRG